MQWVVVPVLFGLGLLVGATATHTRTTTNTVTRQSPTVTVLDTVTRTKIRTRRSIDVLTTTVIQPARTVYVQSLPRPTVQGPAPPPVCILPAQPNCP
jgi:hypothetical protein